MTRMNDSHTGVHLVVDFVLVPLLDLVLSCPVPAVGSALDVLLHVLIPAVGSALAFLLHVFALLLGMFFSYPLCVRSFRPFVLACLLELYSLPGVAACECVSLAPRAPYSHRLRSVVPWFVKGMHCLDELFARPRADPRVFSSARFFTCCACTGGLPAPLALNCRCTLAWS